MVKSKRSIIVVDIALVVGLVLCLISDKEINLSSVWRSFHCIVSAVWFALMGVHVWQHWKLIKAFRMSKVRLKNRLTTLTIAVFVVMFFSLFTLIVAATARVVHFHNVFAHIFLVVVIVHLIAKGKRLAAMIERRE